MTKTQRLRFKKVSSVILAVGLIVGLILFALQNEINAFLKPHEVIASKPKHTIRLGGVVDAGSIVRGEALKVSFTVKDDREKLVVEYDGILPDLFREEQTIIAIGEYQPPVFKATQIMAKHDENYKPRVMT